MKPCSFEYIRATSLDDVFVILDEKGDDAKILAGGQSLVPALNMRFAAPEILIDVSNLVELKGVELEGNVLRIGAMNTHTDILNSTDVAQHAPLISVAMPSIAHSTIRNRGTFGGSICNADPASEIPACIIAANAELYVQNSLGPRTVSAQEFFQGTYTTDLETNELLISISIPTAGENTRVYFDELTRRKGDFAMAGIAAQCEIKKGKFISANLVFFGVVEQAVRAKDASQMIVGSHIDKLDVEAVCSALVNEISPYEDLTTSGEAKEHMIKVLLRRALAAFAQKEA